MYKQWCTELQIVLMGMCHLFVWVLWINWVLIVFYHELLLSNMLMIYCNAICETLHHSTATQVLQNYCKSNDRVPQNKEYSKYVSKLTLVFKSEMRQSQHNQD